MSYSKNPRVRSTSGSSVVEEAGGRRGRREFRNSLLPYLGTDAAFRPGGELGSVFQNLFGPGGEGSQDYLGARQALQDQLGGNLQGAYDTAYKQLLPSTLEGIRRGSAGLAEGFGPMGLRFSSDLMGAQGGLASSLLSDLSGKSIGAALPIFQQQGNSLGGLINLLGSAQQNLSPAALLSQFLATFPPVGSHSEQH